MFQPSDGLRFDVYERVHLPQDVADIHELEEIELTPYIQAVQQGEQVLLRGQLLLSGVYSSQGGDDGARELEHFIPVEITLPVNRVNRLEDITVEVDNFDVDLLSARTLNITGVLSLKGVEARGGEPSPAYAWGDEPFTVVHRRDSEAEAEAETQASEQSESPEASAGVAGANAFEGRESPEWAEASERARRSQEAKGFGDIAGFGRIEGAEDLGAKSAAAGAPHRHEAVSAANAFAPDELKARAADSAPSFVPVEAEDADAPASAAPRQAEQPEAPPNRAAEPPAAAAGWHAFASADSAVPSPVGRTQQNGEPEAWEADIDTARFSGYHEAFGSAADEFALPEPAGPEPIKAEMRIAFGAARGTSEPAAVEPVGLSSLLHAGRREQEARQSAEQEQAMQQAEREIRQPPGDDIVWQNLFLGKQQDDHEFRKLRLCIVQRDETLETIAGRYQLNPREIVLYNRLSANNVSEGQVLMIP
ncbi:LysM peptidoglycan-binding domain-containing protein [uncultured Paenibacillus sp.]|uniref:LysM peptidoglycan-binding domain-containing protein n=1 Tax=uncultured Paenibacillus sp. TaxID=227322 RepID=UPI0028D408D5|nr:LysM peptidoglycan-binding domain-containing protein [uncultured Paenibacillus sp.]